MTKHSPQTGPSDVQADREMAKARHRNTVLVLCLIIAILSVGYARSVWQESLLSIRVAFADDQIRIFEEMTSKAAESKVEEAIQFLKYAVTYYPSGTKQLQGSELDRIVERARANAVASMIDVLKRKTGKDLGDDPQNWIE